MEESVFYIGQGDPQDKQSQESHGICTSMHTSSQFSSFRQADCSANGAVLTGIGPGERLIVASPTKALVNVYVWGKEGIDQRIPVPEVLNCLAVCKMPASTQAREADVFSSKPGYRVPWLLVGGSKSGKVYVWELLSGNMIFAKDVHYQSVTKLQFSKCGTFLFSSSEDSRCIVYRVTDLVALYNKDRDAVIKPFCIFTDHSLPVSDFAVSDSVLINDIKLYTVSKDCTVRVYNVMSKQLLTTFVLPFPITSITRDPADRALYVGMSNGAIRTIALYQRNVHTSTLEAVGGMGQIVSLDNDPDLAHTSVFHQADDEDVSITKVCISMDGMNIVSGDSKGRVFISDTVTKQIIKTLQPLNAAITSIQVDRFAKALVNNEVAKVDKKQRLIPSLKRNLVEPNDAAHEVYMEIPGQQPEDADFEAWLDSKADEEMAFKNLTTVSSTVVEDDKTSKVTKAYNDLKRKYEQLLKDHKDLLQQGV